MFRPRIDAKSHVRLITSNAEFDALEEEWNTLLGHTDTSVFQTFEWLRTWWKYFAKPNYRLHIIVFIYEQRIVGIAPLFIERQRVLGLRIFSRLQFIGRGLSDYVDCIIQPGFEQIVLNAFAHYLNANSKQWDVFDVEDVNERSPLVKIFPDMLRNHGINVYQYQGNVCPYINLPTSSEMLLPSLGPTTSYNFKRKFKRLQQGFKAEVETYKEETDDIQRAVAEFSHIHGGRWKSQGYPSAFDDEKHRAFHVEFSCKFARRGWLRIFFLKVNDLPVAVSYSFNYNKRIYMYQSNAHGTDDVMKCSPGFLVRSIAMVDGIEEGMRVFDFLRGDETYKYKEWKAIDSKNYLIRASSPTHMSRPRFMFFLMFELLMKCTVRVKREYYQFRRFNIVKPRTAWEKVRYVGLKITDLFALGYNFIVRHSPFRSIQKLQIERRKWDEEPAPSKELAQRTSDKKPDHSGGS
ncbi:MAG: GNAT family N-acetyltransferase [Ignavibacteria bacterium]|nr:GNAT family N-acetyltransferase [Ignavibacteria bacterium]